MSARERGRDGGDISGLGTAMGGAFGDGVVGAPPETQADESAQADRPTTLDAVPDSEQDAEATSATEVGRSAD